MRKLVITWVPFLLLALFAGDVAAQQKSVPAVVKEDAVKKANKKVLIVDGVISKSELKDINPDSVLLVDKMISPQEVGSSQKDSTVLVTIINSAAKKYQKKLSAFSNDYKHYLDKHNGDDSHIYYTIDEKILGNDLSSRRYLYLLPEDKIDMVVFSDSYLDKGVNCVVCFIKTKLN